MTISVSSFVTYISNNDNFVFPTVAIMIILGIILLIISIKKWLKEKQNTIINLKNTDEGKKERKLLLIKKSLIMFIDWILFMILLNLNSIEFGIEIFIKDVITEKIGEKH